MGFRFSEVIDGLHCVSVLQITSLAIRFTSVLSINTLVIEANVMAMHRTAMTKLVVFLRTRYIVAEASRN